jgi:fermentation-respiration switch protein FrsA (DUF1100 family)
MGNKRNIAIGFQYFHLRAGRVHHRVSPTPPLMMIAENDATVPTSSQYETFTAAGEPKTLAVIKDCEHLDLYFGNKLEENDSAQLEFLRTAFNKP